MHGLELLHSYLVDTKGEITITLNVSHNPIARFEPMVLLGQGICIKNFKIAQKTVYDHGDCDCILVLHDTTILETIPSVYKEYKFVPTTTIR